MRSSADISSVSIIAITGGMGLIFATLGGARVFAGTGGDAGAEVAGDDSMSVTLEPELIDDDGEYLASSIAPSRSATEISSPKEPKVSILEAMSRLTKTGRVAPFEDI